MGDENDYLNFEEGQSVHRTTLNDGSSPLSDLRNQLQVLNLGEGSKAKSKTANFLSAPLQSIENLDSEQKKTQSNAFASDFSFFSNVENEGNNRNVLDVFSSIDAGFESSIDTFLNGTVKPSSSRRSLTDLESLMSDSVRPEQTEMLSTPPKSTKYEDSPFGTLRSPFNSPLDNIFGASSNNAEHTVQSELLVSTVEVTETVTQTTSVEENSGQLLLKIATPYKTKTIPLRGLDSEESDYSKKRDLLLQSDKKLYGKLEGRNAREKGRSLLTQLDKALSDKGILSDGKESTVIPSIETDESENNTVKMNGTETSSKTENDGVQLVKKDEIKDSQSTPTTQSCESDVLLHSILKSEKTIHNASPKQTNTAQRVLHFAETSSFGTSNATTNLRPPVGTGFLSGGELNRIRESIMKDLEMLPQKVPVVRSDSAVEIGADLNPTEPPVSTFVPECTETEGRKQVTFALSDEIIQPSSMPNCEIRDLKVDLDPFDTKPSNGFQEIRYWCPEDIDMSSEAEPNMPVVLDSDDEEAYQSLSSSVIEEAPFVGGTPLALRDLADQLQNSWLNFSYNVSPNLERTCVADSDAPLNSPASRKSMSETIVLEIEESDSDESENFLSVNSTLPNMQDVESDESQSDDTPKFEDESFEVYEMEPNRTLTVSGNLSFASACRIREFKSDSRDECPPDLVIPLEECCHAGNVSACMITEKIHKATKREDVSVPEEKEVRQNWDDMDVSLTVPLTVYMAHMKASGLSDISAGDGCASTVFGQTEVDASATDMTDEKNTSVHCEAGSKCSTIGAQRDETIINRSSECIVKETKVPFTKSSGELILGSENQIAEHEPIEGYSSGSSTTELDENPETEETSIDGDERPRSPSANAGDENPGPSDTSSRNKMEETRTLEKSEQVVETTSCVTNMVPSPFGGRYLMNISVPVDADIPSFPRFTQASSTVEKSINVSPVRESSTVHLADDEVGECAQENIFSAVSETNVSVGKEVGKTQEFENDPSLVPRASLNWYEFDLTKVNLESLPDMKPTLAPIANTFVERSNVGDIKDELIPRALKKKCDVLVRNETGEDRKFGSDSSFGSNALSDECHHELTGVNLEANVEALLVVQPTLAPIELFTPGQNSLVELRSEEDISDDVLARSFKDDQLARHLKELSVRDVPVGNEIGEDQKFGGVSTIGSSALSSELDRELAGLHLEAVRDIEPTQTSMDLFAITPESFVKHLSYYKSGRGLRENDSSDKDAEMTRIFEELEQAVENAECEESHILHSPVSDEADYVDPSVLVDEMPVKDENEVVGQSYTIVTEDHSLEDSEVEISDSSSENDYEMTRDLGEIEMAAAATDVARGESHRPYTSMQSEADLEDCSSLAAALALFDKLTGKLSPIREEDSIVGDLNEVNTSEEHSTQTTDDSYNNDAEVTRKLGGLESEEMNALPSECALDSPVSGSADFKDRSLVETILNSLDRENETTGHQHRPHAQGDLSNGCLNETSKHIQNSQLETSNLVIDAMKIMTSRFSGEFEERELLNASMHFRAEDTSLLSPKPVAEWSPDMGKRIVDYLNDNTDEDDLKAVMALIPFESEENIRCVHLEPVKDEFRPPSTGENDLQENEGREVAANVTYFSLKTEQSKPKEKKETNEHRSEGTPNRDVHYTSHTNLMSETHLSDTNTDPQSLPSSACECESESTGSSETELSDTNTDPQSFPSSACECGSESTESSDTELSDTNTDPHSLPSCACECESESTESSINQSSCGLDITRRISTEFRADERKLEMSVVTEAGIRSSQVVQEDECKNLSNHESSGSHGVYENCVQNATFDLIISSQLRNVANMEEPSEANTNTLSDLSDQREENHFVSGGVKTTNDEENVANVNSTMIISEKRSLPSGFETNGANEGVNHSRNYADLAFADPSSVRSPHPTRDSLPKTEVRMTVSDCDAEPAKRDPSSGSEEYVADVVDRVAVENLPHSEPEPFDVGLSCDNPFTPIMPRLQTGLTASSAKAAKIQASLDRLLTPLRQNINRLCTPMNVSHQRNVNRSDISELGPSVTLEQCEDSNKTRLVLELPTNLLDVSLSTLDNMFQHAAASTVDAEMNSGESVENDSTTSEKAKIEDYEKLVTKYEQLKSICLIQRQNEEELKRAYDKAMNCVRELENRYEKFRDYVNRYIDYMNEEYEKLQNKSANKT